MPFLRRIAVPILLWVVASIYCWWRVPVGARSRIWAEDGAVFLQGGIAGAAPWRPYDGYLHVVPRLVADAIVAVVPAGRWDVAVTLAAVALVGLVCALTWILTEEMIESRWVRALVAIAPALLPAAGGEAVGNLANLHGFGLWLAFWLVLHRPATRGAAVAWAVAGVLVALTEVTVVLLVPLMVVGWRDQLRWIPRAGLLAGGLAQVLVTLLDPRPDRGEVVWSVPDLVVGFAGETGAAVWTGGGDLSGRIVEAAGPTALLVLLVPAAVAIGLVAQRGDPRHRMAAVGLLAGAGTVWTASIVANAVPMTFAGWSADDWRIFGLGRYAVTSGLFLIAVPLVALDVLRSRVERVAGVAFGVLVVVAALLAYRPETVVREQGPAWPTPADLADRCAGPTGGASEIRVQIAPDLPGWQVVLPCDRAH